MGVSSGMESAAETLQNLPGDCHLLFDLVHFVLCIQADRADLGDGFEATSKLHPLASWVSAMMSCFAGGLLVNPLCGEPVLAALGDSLKLVMATVLWFLLYYCPQDLAYQFSKMFPVRAIMYSIKGLYYPKKVLAGMRHASHALSNSSSNSNCNCNRNSNHNSNIQKHAETHSNTET